MLNTYYADLHVHIGRSRSGKPVKITGAKTLTLPNILDMASDVKGINLLGIIDCHVPEVIQELEEMLESGVMAEHEEGGLWYEKVCLLPGSEIEIYDERCQGPIHVLVIFPSIEKMKAFSFYMADRMKNITLSSQRIYESAHNLQRKTRELGGLFIPAHVFTPHKSLYGKGVKTSLSEVFLPDMIDAVELGLSSDTTMALSVEELRAYPFLSNSDAHSLEKIGREYQTIVMEKPTFLEFKMALRQEQGRRVTANYGLNPRLGKYYETTCANCSAMIVEEEGTSCPQCGSSKTIRGVKNRINELGAAARPLSYAKERPPYIHQVPLEFIPALGPKTLQKLRNHFGTDMAILHEVEEKDLMEAAPEPIVHHILRAREGKLSFHSGGGGKYGKVASDKSTN
ncbi:endonuclease Q family protein [Fictibacillus terranigra]|uniref:Endonuclease Q family protein n=1 Tax=Fictibacillus terranigra TaxID=3058424 RepID=A0ABT8E9Q3_9BACL|nr:endonuclease Q family protein [Fictibacillus sp. CENA-BCM004]MDN4074642.1 endonuclease Q family protein [Fictibacillus sp. CENA-BCM004]